MYSSKYILSLAAGLLLAGSSCSDYLEVMPENSQVAEDYWKTEADVENVLFGGYYYLRSTTESYLIPWGETRLGMVYNAKSTTPLQSWQMTASNSLCNWSSFYQVINVANTVLERAAEAQAADDTYTEAALRSHYTEAYFLRALSYFYLVRNFRDVPMPLSAYSDDHVTINLPKVSEDTIVTQIKADLKAALATGAAKESFSTTWETKGRATKWAIYALLADVCLWEGDYDGCIQYADGVLNATGAKAPAFMATSSRQSYMSIFNPGNSNESIFELQWNYEEDQTNNLPTLFDDAHSNATYAVSPEACTDFVNEYIAVVGDADNALTTRESARTYHAAFYPGSNGMAYGLAKGYVWKYIGSTTEDKKRTSTYYDPNFILYRVADVILMKAEALLCQNGGHPTSQQQLEAVRLIDRIRKRAGLESYLSAGTSDVEAATEELSTKTAEDLLAEVLDQRKLEFLGEGKIWYDVLRMGRRNGNQYKQDFLVEQVVRYNTSASESWLRSVLNSDNALFLPIPQSEIDRNAQLVQNTYYK